MRVACSALLLSCVVVVGACPPVVDDDDQRPGREGEGEGEGEEGEGEGEPAEGEGEGEGEAAEGEGEGEGEGEDTLPPPFAELDGAAIGPGRRANDTICDDVDIASEVDDLDVDDARVCFTDIFARYVLARVGNTGDNDLCGLTTFTNTTFELFAEGGDGRGRELGFIGTPGHFTVDNTQQRCLVAGARFWSYVHMSAAPTSLFFTGLEARNVTRNATLVAGLVPTGYAVRTLPDDSLNVTGIDVAFDNRGTTDMRISTLTVQLLDDDSRSLWQIQQAFEPPIFIDAGTSGVVTARLYDYEFDGRVTKIFVMPDATSL